MDNVTIPGLGAEYGTDEADFLNERLTGGQVFGEYESPMRMKG